MCVSPVLECQRPAVRFGDLAAQYQADSRSSGLGGEEWNEQIACIRETGSFIIDPHFNASDGPAPADSDAASGLQRGVDGVAHEVD